MVKNVFFEKAFFFCKINCVSFLKRHCARTRSGLQDRNRECLRPEFFLRHLRARRKSLVGKLVILLATSRDVSLSFAAGLNLLTSRSVNKLSPRRLAGMTEVKGGIRRLD